MILLDDYLFNYTLLDDYLFNYTHHSYIIYKIITFMRFLHNQKKKKERNRHVDCPRALEAAGMLKLNTAG